MTPANLNSKAEVRALLESRGLTLKKRFGQNFLIDAKHRERIVAALELQPGQKVWEIGPGIGSITQPLLAAGADLTLFEIDHGLIRVLKEFFGDSVAIVEGDFLKTFPSRLVEAGAPDKIIGNLPYSSGSVMIGELIERDLVPSTAVFTLQKEVAMRMCARPGGKEYSAFSLVCQFRSTVERLGDIGGGAFFPPPQIVSSIVRLRRRPDAPAGEFPIYFLLVHDLFRSRRKTAANNLRVGSLSSRAGWSRIKSIADELSIDLGRRGETFSRDEVFRFARRITDKIDPA